MKNKNEKKDTNSTTAGCSTCDTCSTTTTTTTTTTTAIAKDKDHKKGKHRSFDLGSLILGNLRTVITAVVILILASISFGVFNHYREKKITEMNNAIYSFRVDAWSAYQKDKLSDGELVAKWGELLKQIGVEESVGAISIEIGNYLIEKNRLSPAEEVLRPVLILGKKNPYLNFFLAETMLVIYEDTGRFEQAVTLLENLLKSKVKFFESKIYFDLGRLYQQLGNKDKAKLNFQHVVDNYTQDHFAKLAKAYLKKI